jgi:predicted dehydrogenase
MKIVLVGLGRMGKNHLRVLRETPGFELAAVVDGHATPPADLGSIPFLRNTAELSKIDFEAAVIATPTATHHSLALELLAMGKHLLVEKPIASTFAQGREVIEAANAKGVKLAVGHVERFNPARRGIEAIGKSARYIESHRLAPFTFRSTDIGVVLDLMIHDLDLVLALVQSPIVSVEAFGGAVFTPAEDMASAIIKFENKAVAHLTANRVALKPMRKMRVFSKEGYVSLDFQNSQGLVVRKAPGWDFEKLDLQSLDRAQMGDLWKFVFDGLLQVENLTLDTGNPLRDELVEFLACVRERTRPTVTGEDGVAALAAAERVLEVIAANRWT